MIFVIWTTIFDGVNKFGPYMPEEAAVQERHLCDIARKQHGMTVSGTPGEMWDFTKGKEWTGCVYTYDNDPHPIVGKGDEQIYQRGKKWSAKKAAEKAKEADDELERNLRKEVDRSEIARKAAHKAWKTMREKDWIEKRAKQNPQGIIIPPTQAELSTARPCAILPSGKLDTTTGLTKYFKMADKASNNSALIVAKDPRDDTIRIICGAGDGAFYLKAYPTLQKLTHDQTGKRIGYGKFIESVQGTDYSKLQKYGRKLKFYVFK